MLFKNGVTYSKNQKRDHENVIPHIPRIRRIQRYQQKNKLPDASISGVWNYYTYLLSD